jgi:hypothetical protein
MNELIRVQTAAISVISLSTSKFANAASELILILISLIFSYSSLNFLIELFFSARKDYFNSNAEKKITRCLDREEIILFQTGAKMFSF